MLGAKVIICKPADPEAKGLLERVHGYLETSFLPGRSFTGPADFNTQLHPVPTGRAQRPRKWRTCPGAAPACSSVMRLMNHIWPLRFCRDQDVLAGTAMDPPAGRKPHLADTG